MGIEIWIGLGCIVGCLLLVQAGMHIAVALMLLSLLGVSAVIGIQPAGRMLASSSISSISSYLFGVIPLFVLMGLVVSVTSLGRDLFDSAGRILSGLRGGLGMATVLANAVFAACTGTSIASASVFTRIAVPEMERHGHTTRFSVGVVAGSSILGVLSPPSLLFIVFGVIANVSIGALFIAAILPGALMAVAFCATIFLLSVFRPSFVYASGSADHHAQPTAEQGDKAPATVRLWSVVKPLIPVDILVLVVLGGIYGGFFTATEAAAISLMFATILGIARGLIKVRDIIPLLRETMATTGAIFFIAACAKIFVALIALTGLSNSLVGLLDNAEISVWFFILCVCLIYLVLGMFLDPVGIMVLTLPLMIPMVESSGLNLIWFGVVIVKLLEIGLITPPVGLNVFVLASVLEDKVEIGKIFSGLWRFLGIDIVVLTLLILVPAISLYLPMSMN